MRDVLRERFHGDVVASVDEHGAERLHRGRLVHEVQRHLGVRLLGEAHSLEVDMEQAAGHGVARDTVDQCRDRIAVEALERQQGGVAPAAVRAFKGAKVRLDRGGVLASAEDDARQHALAAELGDLLAHHLAGTDSELFCVGQNGTPL